ncbi:unnamed protein product [Didymodactylos carnosus]|uniref:Uncharacterized protein n=1 Tax=Didymodactylos carnosus TaxID=1234261 RepID=A0A814C0R0_9BILA|nr:unnamed protein product [Didymodactylos carnosus]CAF3711239.1 unnamed protein product [Didymodactylos carnosus]
MAISLTYVPLFICSTIIRKNRYRIEKLHSRHLLEMPMERFATLQIPTATLIVILFQLIQKEIVAQHQQYINASAYQDLDHPLSNDYRQLNTLSLIREISHNQYAYSRRNIIDGVNESLEHYSDVYFCLLREDFIELLRDSIQHFKSRTPSKKLYCIVGCLYFLKVKQSK